MFSVDRAGIAALIEELQKQGYTVIGPTIRDQAIVYDEIQGIEDLPEGWTDEQEKGKYRLKRRQDRAMFGYVVGPTSWKKYLYPPRLKILDASRDGSQFTVKGPEEEAPKYAFLGVRSCDLSAIAVQDKVFCDGSFVDSTYKKRRDKALIIAVNCGEARNTCFCTSMDTGPKAKSGYDLAITEIIEGDRHYFVVDGQTDKGKELLESIEHQEATDDQVEASGRTVQNAVNQISRKMQTDDLKDLFYQNVESSHWAEVADRCLSCANCTMACPTCFCSTVEEVTDLTGDHAERWRLWDSCFNMEFSYIHGGHIRSTTESRYRQWITHKLASWQDQFDVIGCVGCGRCITWCPVGIDITEETEQLRHKSAGTSQSKHKGGSE